MGRLFVVLIWGLIAVGPCFADVFDRYTNPVLGKAVESAGVVAIEKLTPGLAAAHSQLFQESGAVMVIVRTNSGNNAKLLAQFAQQKYEKAVAPMALLERVTTYKPGQERAIQAGTSLVHLYDGFVFHLDVGQVTPTSAGGDLRYVHGPEGGVLEPVGKAKLFLVTKHLPEVEPKKVTGRNVLGEAFDPLQIAGSYQLFDDGRRKALLELKIDGEGNLTGSYTSEQTGRKYEVTGKSTPTMKHHITFTVKFPNSVQEFVGYVFTKDAGTICGWTKLQGQEFGFYGVRER